MSYVDNYVFDASQIQNVFMAFPELDTLVLVPKIENPEDEATHPLSWRVPETGLVDGYSEDGKVFTPCSKYPNECLDVTKPDEYASFEFDDDGNLYIICDEADYDEIVAAATIA